VQVKLELLAPAKNMDIGIAAINCGADALYIAGPSFGAREEQEILWTTLNSL
jgi:putative protease